MTKRMVFMIFMLASCAVLFLQRFTGMGVHAVLGLAVLIASICHTVKYRKVWKTRPMSQKLTELILWLMLLAVVVSGILLKPIGDVAAVLMVHKVGSIVFVVCILLHIKKYMKRKICAKKP